MVGHTRGLLLPREPCAELRGAWWCGTSRLVGDLIVWRGFAIAVNPQQRLVGTLLDVYAALRAGVLARSARTPHPTLCVVDKLDDCKLSERGLTTPSAQRLIGERTRQPARTTHGPRDPEPPAPQQPAAAPVGSAGDARQAEYLRRAEGLDTEQRLALIKEMFLPSSEAS